MAQKSISWVDLQAEYKESYRSLEDLKQRRKGTGSMEDTVDCELAGSMMGELASTIKELKNRSLHEFNSISVEDILNPAYGLTERQREVALLRQNRSYREIGDILGIDTSTAFLIHKSCCSKIYTLKQSHINMFSKRQLEIIKLMDEGKTRKEMTEILGVSINSLRTHTKAINKKLAVAGGVKKA